MFWRDRKAKPLHPEPDPIAEIIHFFMPPECGCAEIAGSRQKITTNNRGDRLIGWYCQHGNLISYHMNSAILLALQQTNISLEQIFSACAAVARSEADLTEQIELVRAIHGNEAADHLTAFIDAVLQSERRTQQLSSNDS